MKTAIIDCDLPRTDFQIHGVEGRGKLVPRKRLG